MTVPGFSTVWAHPWKTAVAMAALLILFPMIDIWASSLFFDTATSLWVKRTNLMQFARSGVPPLIIGALLFSIALWTAGRALKQYIWSLTGRKILYLILTLALGPGLIVESVLKVYVGRARPRDIMAFGGQDVFTPALWLSDACTRNCSFVSGHAALAFWTTAFAFLVPKESRAVVFVSGLALGALMGITRMAEGAHFLSDVVFSGIIVVGLNIWLAHRLLLKSEEVEVKSGA